MEIAVVIIEDSEATLETIESWVENMPPISFGGELINPKVHPILISLRAGERVNLEQIMTKVSRTKPGVAVVDLRLEGDTPRDFSGLDLSLRLKAVYSDCCVILHSAYFADNTESELFRKLEVFRESIEIGPESEARFQKAVGEALQTHASSVYYRGHRFRQTVNGGRKEMWGLVIGNGQKGVRIDTDIPLPQLKSNSVVVKPIEIGVCGSNRASLGVALARPNPLIDFHEAFGEVVWVGEAVRDLDVGDHVIPMVRRCTPWDEPPEHAPIGPASQTFHVCDHKTHECYGRPDECPVGEFIKPGDNGSRVGYKSRGTGKCHGFGSQYFLDTEEWLIRVELPKDSALRDRMMSRYVLTEPLSILWKARREILKHYRLNEYNDEVLVIGLGPIGLLGAFVMRKLHPGLRLVTVDLANKDTPRVQLAYALGNTEYVQAKHGDETPEQLKGRKFQIIIEATDRPDQVFGYGSELLSSGGILVLLGIAEEGSVDIDSRKFTQFVKRNNLLLGSINSSRSDFRDSVAFMEKVFGDEESMLEKMVSRWDIDDWLGEKLRDFGNAPRVSRQDIKIVLNAKKYSDRLIQAPLAGARR
jgi:threonine dehydrogenase-like Zn-dependent dehydrogenase